MFLIPSITTCPEYPEIFRIAHDKATKILDMGHCYGQNLRLLASNQVPTDKMYATDVNNELWELGFELFKDTEKMHATFIHADIFDRDSGLGRWDRCMDIVLACQFLYLFDWEGQMVAMKRIVRLSRPGCLVVGYQRGQVQAQECERPWGTMHLHDMESFRSIWEQVGKETGTRWTLNASMVDLRNWGMEAEDTAWMPAGHRGINFVAMRQHDRGTVSSCDASKEILFHLDQLLT